MADEVDSIIVNVPLITRLFEYFMENDVEDVKLHKILEKVISKSKESDVLSMDDYDDIIGSLEDEETKEEKLSRLYEMICK